MKFSFIIPILKRRFSIDLTHCKCEPVPLGAARQFKNGQVVEKTTFFRCDKCKANSNKTINYSY